ncbi:MAG: hypothetical protein JWQ16_1776, partial [Novosphingobium sp.]|nr:hypothetical protein [Novosphingobium sp.]
MRRDSNSQSTRTAQALDEQSFRSRSRYDNEASRGRRSAVVLDGEAGLLLNWNRDLMQNRNRSSHYMISDASSFNTLFNALLNRQSQWLVINPERVA